MAEASCPVAGAISGLTWIPRSGAAGAESLMVPSQLGRSEEYGDLKNPQ